MRHYRNVFTSWRGIPMPLIAKRLLACLALATLYLATSELPAQTSVVEVTQMDLTGMEVDLDLCASDDWVLDASARVMDASHLEFSFQWACGAKPSGPAFLGLVHVGLPGSDKTCIAELQWDGGAILIDLTDF